jgi:hypothetical protein
MKYVPIFLASGGMLVVAPKQKKGDYPGDFAKLSSIITYLSLTEKTNMRKAKIKRF